jgi:sulfur carrier protein
MLWYNFIMKIVLNGEEKELSTPMTLQQLLDSLEIPSVRVACEVNLKIIRRAMYPGTTLNEGDAVEIIQAIGGG